MNQRNNTADFAKGIAVLLMIQVHVMQLFALPDIFQSTLGKISLFLGGPPVAPMFLAIMGYYILASKRTITQHFSRGFKLIFFGILLNIGINLHLFYKIYTGTFSLNPLEYIFGMDIFFCAGLSIIFIALIKNFISKYIWLAPLLALVFVLIAGFINPSLTTNSNLKYFAAILGGNYNWSYFPVFPWIAYSLIGISLFQIQQKINLTKKHLLIFLVIGIIPVVATINYAVEITHQLKLYYHHNIVFFLWTILFLILWIILCDFLEKIVTIYNPNNFLIVLGRNVTAAYTFQWIIIGNTATAVYKSLTLGQSLFSVFFIILLTIGFVFIKERFLQRKSI